MTAVGFAQHVGYLVSEIVLGVAQSKGRRGVGDEHGVFLHTAKKLSTNHKITHDRLVDYIMFIAILLTELPDCAELETTHSACLIV